MSGDLVIKIDLKALKIGLVIALLGIASVKTVGVVKAASGLTGQYGCITNKNFSGFTTMATWRDGDSTTSIVASNYMLYLDFDAGTMKFSAVGATKWGVSGVSGTEIVGGSGSLAASPTTGMTNTFTASTSIVHAGVTWASKYYLMSVNSGNTLLLTEGMGLNGSGSPNTGVCNKI